MFLYGNLLKSLGKHQIALVYEIFPGTSLVNMCILMFSVAATTNGVQVVTAGSLVSLAFVTC